MQRLFFQLFFKKKNNNFQRHQQKLSSFLKCFIALNLRPSPSHATASGTFVNIQT